MIDISKFKDDDFDLAREFFKDADSLLQKAIDTPGSSLAQKINEDGEINRHHISEAYFMEETRDAQGEIVEKKRPVIDLVQQGGGMWGIALLGYCYILEKVGIRFFGYGGTSAGAINALFLSSIPAEIYKEKSMLFPNQPERHGLKSELLTLIVSNMDFSAFIDSGGIAKWIQMKLFKSVGSKLWKVFIALALLLILGLVYFGISYGLQGYGLADLRDASYLSFILAASSFAALFVLLYVIVLKKLGEDFGLNTGDKFLDWVKEYLQQLGINTTADLEDNLNKTFLTRDPDITDTVPAVLNYVGGTHIKVKKDKDEPPVIYSFKEELREERLKEASLKNKVLEYPKIVIVTANLTHSRIVRFPQQASMYWKNPSQVHPAAYVRASMSLPFIFETFVPNTTSHFYVANPEEEVNYAVRMVDGGMLSNFPIRDFHRSDGAPPSFPTFGVLLSERPKVTSDPYMKGKKNTLGRFINSFIATFRNFYDNEYLDSEGEEEMEMLIKTVDTLKKGSTTEHISWLDFGMLKPDKKLLFQRGAEAAIRQLENFEWTKYKELRKQ